MSKLLKNTGLLGAFIAVYYIFLYIFLLNFSINFGYFSTPSYDLTRFIIGLILSMFGVFLLNLKDGKKVRLSTFFFVLQLLLVYIPANLFISLHSEYSFLISILLILSLYIIFILTELHTRLLKGVIKKRIALDIKYIIGGPFLIWFLSCIIIFFVLLAKKGISFGPVFDEAQLYSFRSDVFNQYSTVQLISFYSLAYFLFPLILLYSIKYKKIYLLVVILIANLLVYSFTGMKTYFVIPFFTLYFYWLIKDRSVKSFFAISFFTVIVLCLITYSIGVFIHSNYPTALFLRSVIEPAQLHVIWIDFFYDKDKIPFWVLNPGSHPDFMGLKWEEIIARNLGGTIGNGEGANVGFIANSFSVYGISGLIIYSFILSFFIGFLNFIYSIPKNGWVAAASIPALFLLTNTSFVGVFIYFGLGFTVIASLCLVNLLPKKIQGLNNTQNV